MIILRIDMVILRIDMVILRIDMGYLVNLPAPAPAWPPCPCRYVVPQVEIESKT
jgi:hypothetical protein